MTEEFKAENRSLKKQGVHASWKRLMDKGEKLKLTMDKLAEVTRVVIQSSGIGSEVSVEIRTARKHLSDIRNDLSVY